jgi:Ca2+-binding RTX toxin-like protein
VIGTTTENLVVNLNGGNDTFSASGNLAALIAITVDGGAGNDIINGSNGGDVLRGGDDNDTIDGQQGSDAAFLGAGDDTFRWDPGDGSDTVEGQDGTDTLVFNGANINERFDVSANGARVRFTRDIASIVMDLDDTELIDTNAIGGADIITVNDLTGTDVTAVDADLAGAVGGGTGDGQADTVVVNGTAGADAIAVSGAGTSAQVTGLAAQVNIRDAEAANDALVVDARADIDTVTATALPAGVIRLTVDGGPGNDAALLSPGDDVFRWDPGDGSDTVEGAAGTDRLVFNGANISEQFDVLANGARVSVTRNVASIAMDLDDVEVIDLNALGGADILTVGNLGGTDVTRVDADLAGVLGGATGDGQPDTVDVTGTDGDDVVVVAGDASGVSVFGLAAAVQITGADAGFDVQSVHALGGDDVIDASGVAAGAISLHLFGGDGDDVLLGGDGDDSLFGEAGDDVLIGNGGNDILDGGPGSNIVIQ